jgi:hypothetical protein
MSKDNSRVLLEFKDESRFLEAAQALHKRGNIIVDAFTPYAVDEVAELIREPDRRIQYSAIVGAVVGIVSGYFLQYYASVVSYPLHVAGRPLNSVPAFIQVTFELMVLCGSLATVLALLFFLGLPKLHQNIFEFPGIDQASKDSFLLLIDVTSPPVGGPESLFDKLNPAKVSYVDE